MSSACLDASSRPAEENSNKLDSRLRAAEEALVKAEAKYKNSPDDAAAKADYEAKNNAANDLANEKAGEDNVIADVEKALEKIKKTPAPVKRAGKAKDDDDESSVIKTNVNPVSDWPGEPEGGILPVLFFL